MADIRFQREHLADLWSEVMPLLQAHQAEVNADPDAPALEIDRVTYEKLEALGRLAVFTAREGTALVGYAAFIVAQSLRDPNRIAAHHDAMYLVPAARLGTTALDFLLFAEHCLAEDGVNVVRQLARPESAFGAVLARAGYQVVEIAHEKRLEAVA